MKTTALVCVVFLACGGSDDGDGGGGGATITVSGAQSGTLPALAVAGRVAGEAFYTVGVTALQPKSPFTSASVSIRLAGTPAAGTYPVSSFQVGALEVSTSDGKSWTAFSTPVIGSIGTLSLTSVEMQSTQGNTTLYTIHGSLSTSTLTQLQGTANLTMTASF